ncbi:unnamed protein product [Auanema sp. JU1783]|nr:unnamed protein product [Auanema sp. JU1783]
MISVDPVDDGEGPFTFDHIGNTDVEGRSRIDSVSPVIAVVDDFVFPVVYIEDSLDRMSDEVAFVAISSKFNDEQPVSSSHPETPKMSDVNANELEDEIRDLEGKLKHEREEKKKLQIEMQDEMDREIRAAEEKWMERARQAMQERDSLAARTQQMEEQLDAIRIDVNRAVAYRLEMEESRNRIKLQLDTVQRDYEETMLERSSVLEENQRLSEERDNLRQTVHELNRILNEVSNRKKESDEVQNLTNKLDQTRRLLQLNMEETAAANKRSTEAMERLGNLRKQVERLTDERDLALRRLREMDLQREPIVDVWNTHTVEVALSYPKPNLGIVLSGGRTDDRFAIHSPIYVKDVLIGSPLENMLKRLDHILIVNDIDVTDMDQRSVIDILKNSHHLKMVIRRRANANKIHEVTLGNSSDIGIELGNGVFVNATDSNLSASRAGIEPGNRVVHVNHVPVYDAKHAEQLIKYSNNQVVIGLLDGKKRTESLYAKDIHSSKQRTLFSKWFGRHNTEKPRNVVAKASIDTNQQDNVAFYRQGSLRIPTPQHVNSELVRYGSLRAPPGADNARIAEKLGDYLNKTHSNRLSLMSDGPGRTWPKSVPEDEPLLPRRRLNRPSVFPVFGTPNSPATTSALRQSAEISSSSRCHGCPSPSVPPWSPRQTRQTVQQSGQQLLLHAPSVEGRLVTSPVSSQQHVAFSQRADNRVSCYSPALPQPPPYPGPREDSMSSVISSTNSLPIPGGSSVNVTYHSFQNNSPTGTLMSDSSEHFRRGHMSRDGSEFGYSMESNSLVPMRMNSHVKRGERLLEVGGINMRPGEKQQVSHKYGTNDSQVSLLVSGQSTARWVHVPRKQIRLCGGNAIGILAEASAGDLQEGDLIMEIDGYNVRGATHEEATEALLESLDELAELLIEDGADRLNRLRLGADGDSFYVRINVDRSSENKDELDIKAGEIVFVDKTMFMGQRGRWRAWKVDREGRQRENGIIPSSSFMERQEQKGRKQKGRSALPPLTRPVYERMERVCSSKQRPVILYGAFVAPFVQFLLDDSAKFTQVVPECRALQSMDVDRLLHTCELIDVRKRDKLFDVISATAVNNIMEQGLHCLIDISPSAIQRLHSLRIHPIVIRIKFKSTKQIKEIREEFTGEKMSSKQAKELQEKAIVCENELNKLGIIFSVIQVPSQSPLRNIVKQVCQQITVHVDHEQKKTVWVACQQ